MKTNYLALLAAMLLLAACKKETHYVYAVEQQNLYQTANEKQTEKSTMQFITIAYSDVFNSNISSDALSKLDIAYQSFGDRTILAEMIVRNFLNNPSAQIPSATTMRANVGEFVTAAYLRFFNRQPTEFEVWKMKDMIDRNPDITPQLVYYSMMTSEEYRYY